MSTEKNKKVDTSKVQEQPVKEEKKEQITEEKKKTTKKHKTLVAGVKKKKKKVNTSKTTNRISNYTTHTGHKLTIGEAKFIDLYIETGNQRQSVIDAGYNNKAPGQYAQALLRKNYIIEEIDYRMQKLEDEKIASAEEIMKYFTGVMRGEIKDQFGLDTPISERTKAAQELAKRKIDIVNKVQGNKDTAEVRITLNWEGMKDDTEESET